MKKIIAVICAVAMLFSFACNAFADEWDFLDSKYTSYEAKVAFYVNLNKPLKCLGAFNEEAGMDVQYMVEQLCKAQFTADIQAEVSKDATAAKIYMGINSNVPINISEDLKFGTDVTLKVWMDYNFADKDNAKYTIIVKNPINGKYLYVDFFDEAVVGAEAEEIKDVVMSTLESLNLEAGIAEITALVKNLYEGNATLEKTNDGYTQISFTNDALVDFYFELIMGMLDTDYMKNAMEISGGDMSALEIDPTEAEQARALVKGLGIFAENDAYTMKFRTNAAGFITEAEEKLHIDLNIVDLAVAMGETEEALYPLTKENADVDLTFVTKAVFDKINEENVVMMPTLTEENSQSLMDAFGVTAPEPEYQMPNFEMYQSEYFWDSAKGMMDRNNMYVAADEFFESCSWDDDNLKGVVVRSDDEITMTITSDNFGTVTVKGNLKKDEYMLNDVKLWARKPFKVASGYDWETYDGKEEVYVNMAVLEYILGAKVQSIQTYILDEDMKALTSPEYYFEVVRPNPGYVAPAEQ